MNLTLHSKRLHRAVTRGRSFLSIMVPALGATVRAVTVDLPFGAFTVRASGILAVMTRTLDAAIAKLAALPPEEQDRVARWLLDELADDELWTRKFEASEDTLNRLAGEARADRAAGRTTDVDPDSL